MSWVTWTTERRFCRFANIRHLSPNYCNVFVKSYNFVLKKIKSFYICQTNKTNYGILAGYQLRGSHQCVWFAWNYFNYYHYFNISLGRILSSYIANTSSTQTRSHTRTHARTHARTHTHTHTHTYTAVAVQVVAVRWVGDAQPWRS